MNVRTDAKEANNPLTSSSSLRTDWFRNAGIGVLLHGIGLVLAFGSSILLARVLGPEGLGQYSYVLAIVSILSVVATVGLPTTVTRLLAAYEVNASWPLARGLLIWSNLVVGGVGLVLALGLISYGTFADSGRHQWLYILAAPLILVLGWTNLRQRTLQGLHRPIESQLPEQVVKHTVFLLIGGLLLFTGYLAEIKPQEVMAIWLLASVASLIVGIVLLRRLMPPELSNARSRYTSYDWLAVAMPIFGAEVMGGLLGNVDTVLLGGMRPADEVGLYQMGLRISGLLLIFLTASNWVLAPWFSRFHATGEIVSLQSVVTRTTRVVFGITVGCYIVMIVAGKYLLDVVFGQDFVAAYPVVLILGAGQLINVASGPVVNLLVMTGSHRQLALSVAFAATTNIALCTLLISEYGMIGAAVAVAVTTAGFNLALARIVKIRSGINATIFG